MSIQQTNTESTPLQVAEKADQNGAQSSSLAPQSASVAPQAPAQVVTQQVEPQIHVQQSASVAPQDPVQQYTNQQPYELVRMTAQQIQQQIAQGQTQYYVLRTANPPAAQAQPQQYVPQPQQYVPQPQQYVPQPQQYVPQPQQYVPQPQQYVPQPQHMQYSPPAPTSFNNGKASVKISNKSPQEQLAYWDKVASEYGIN